MGSSLEVVRPPRGGRNLARQDDHSPASADRLDLSESITFFRRRLLLISSIVAMTVLAGGLYSVFATKVYKAEVTVMIDPKVDNQEQTTALGSSVGLISDELLETQAAIITSRDMAAAVARTVELDKGMTPVQQRELLDALQENVSAERSGESYALTISYEASDPEEAARIANSYALQFTDWEANSDRQRNAQARAEVSAKLAELRDQAQADTQALQQYRISNNLLSTSGASLAEQEISVSNLEVTKARAQAAEDSARLQTALSQLRSGSTGDDVGEALTSPVIASLRTQEATLAGEVASLSARYGANYPELIRTQNQLSDVRSSIQSEIGRVISNLAAKEEVSEQQLGSLNASLGGARGKLTQNNAAMVGLSGLERAAEASQGIYETYLNRYKLLLAAEGTEKPNARILTPAVAPLEANSPNLKLNLVMSVIIGLGLGVIAAYIAEALFHGVTTSDEVERDLGENFLTSIPLIGSVDRSNPHAVSAIRNDPKSVFSKSFRTLSISVDQAMGRPAQVIAITSALPGEGKTVMSCCLSHILAASGERTVLIDCDLRRRGISQLLNVAPDQKGLIEILDGSAPPNLDEMMGDKTFCIIPLQSGADSHEHLITGPAFVDLIDKLRGHFDRIVLDLPPILPVAATRILASRADAVVLAARWRKTSAFAIRAARRRLPEHQVNVVGVALNQVDIRRHAYFDRNDVAYYYHQYKEYYA